MTAHRVIVYHKQATSARTLFLHFAHRSVCAPAPIPAPARLLPAIREDVALHPATALGGLDRQSGLPLGWMRPEGGYRQWVECADGKMPVLLVRIVTTDPPFIAVASAGARFIDLIQARRLPEIELVLLRRAYELILGG